METTDRREANETYRSVAYADRGELTNDDKQAIWDGVSNFIDKQLHSNKAVIITGFGTFGFSLVKCDIGGNRIMLMQRPVFLAAERFLQTLGIQQRKCNPLAGEVPLVGVNYSQISIATGFSRADVERCVREALHTLGREITANRDVQFTFRAIGKLKVRDGYLKMRFFKDFVNSFDSSGRVVSAMQNRPGTADSVMSKADGDLLTTREREFASKMDRRVMQTIAEDQEDQTLTQTQDALNNSEDSSEFQTPDVDRKKYDRPVTRQTNRAALPLPTAANVSLAEVQESTSCLDSTSTKKVDDARRSDVERPESIMSKTVSEREAIFSELPKPAPPPSYWCRPRTAASGTSSRPASSMSLPSMNRIARHPIDSLPSRIADHPHAAVSASAEARSAAASCRNENQPDRASPICDRDLCFVCRNRDKNNVPVSFKEEIRQRDADERELYDAYHEISVATHKMQERERELQKRYESQKDAAFNLGIAEAQKSDRSKRPIHDRFHPSFIFNRRARTPPKKVKQRLVNSVLLDQISTVKENRTKLAEAEAFIDKLERNQTEQQLAQNRIDSRQQRIERTENYKTALALQQQMRDEQEKAERSLQKELDAQTKAVFCDIETHMEAQLEREARAKAIADHQLYDMLRKKREQLLERIRKQANEADMLQRNAVESAEDRAERHARKREAYQQLENDWLVAADMKLTRDLEEMRDRLHTPVGLLQEQLDQYKRCHQCQRKLANYGETYIFSDSRYTNGTRFVV